MKVLVTGAEGMLGSDACWLLSNKGHIVIAAPRCMIDVTCLATVRRMISESGPDVVIHCAAHTNVDEAERDPERAYQVNTIGTWNVALACTESRSQLVYVSTCGVFDGTKQTPYNELDIPNPQTHYHRSKFKAEDIVASLVREHFILRPGWLFGGRVDHRRNFVAQRHREALQATVVHSASDRVGSPTYTFDFIEMAIELIQLRAFGLYHVANSGACSRFEYVSHCLKALGLNTPVIAVGSDWFPRPAPAPASEALDCYFLKLRGVMNLRPWQLAVADYITNRLLPELRQREIE